MPVVSASRDTGDLSLTIVAELAAPPARVWQVWVDPRRLERWWGPPGWPATSVRHDVVVGGTPRCSMTGPEGEEAHGWWRVVAVDEPRSLEFEDCFGEDKVRGMGMEEGMVQAMGQLDELLLTRV